MSNPSALAAVRRRWWVVALLTAVGAGLGALPEPATVEEESLTTTYSATHTLLLNNQELAYSSSTAISPSQIRLFALNGEVPERVAEQIGFDGSRAELASQVQVDFDQETGALTFSTTQDTAEQAVLVADTFAEVTNSYLTTRQDELNGKRIVAATTRVDMLREKANELSAQLAANPTDVAVAADADALQSQLSVAIQQRDQLTDTPAILSFTTLASAEPVAIEQSSGLSTPRSRTTRGALGGIAGLALGLGVAVVLGRLDRRLRSPQQAEDVTGLRARVIVPKATDDKQAQAIVMSGRHDSLSDAYRTLRNVVGFVHTSLPAVKRGRIALIVSPGPGEGKTTLASNLAATFAETGAKTIAVNTDFRRPQLSNRLVDTSFAPSAYTLDDLGWVEPTQLLRSTKVRHLSLLDLGGLGPPGELARETAAMLPALAETHDQIVIDSSPVTATAEVLELVPMADVIIVVVRLNRTQLESAQRTITILRDLTTAPLLLVISGMKQDRTDYYYDDTDRRKSAKQGDNKGRRADTAGRGATPPPPAPLGPTGVARPTTGTPSGGIPRPTGTLRPPLDPNDPLAKLDAMTRLDGTPPRSSNRAAELNIDEIDEFLRQQPPSPPR